MSWTVRAIATPALASGFRLAGLPTDEVANPDEAGTVLSARSVEPGLGILIVEQRLLDATPELVRREVERKPVPVIVPVPSPAWGQRPADAEGLILELLRRAIGYRVKLK
jgi:vacuolar-type H+-ATPase subunit F/Vma7